MIQWLKNTWSGLKAIVDAPQLHAEINRLRVQLEVARNSSGPTFHEVATPIDTARLHNALKERVVEDMAPMLKRHALDNLTKVLYNKSAGDGLSTGRVAMLGAYNEAKDGSFTVQVEVTIPAMRHTISVIAYPDRDNGT